MKIKKIRKLMALISGIALSAMALIFLLIIDTKINIGVSWLMGISVLGIAGGILLVLSSFNSEDEEDKRNFLFSLISLGLLVGFVALMIRLPYDATYTKFVSSTEKNNSYVKVLYYMTFIISIITALIAMFFSVSVTRDHFAYLKIAGKKGQRKIKIIKIAFLSIAAVLIIAGFICLANLNILEGAYTSKTMKNDDGTVRWIEAITVVFSGIGVFFGTGINEVLTKTLTYKLPAGKEPEINVLDKNISVASNSLILFVLILLVLYLVLIALHNRKKPVVRAIPGAVLTIGGILMFFTQDTFVDLFTKNNATLPVDVEMTYSLGMGVILFASFISVAGFMLTLLPLFDITVSADKDLVALESETL